MYFIIDRVNIVKNTLAAVALLSRKRCEDMPQKLPFQVSITFSNKPGI